MWSLLRERSAVGPSESGKLGVFSVSKSKAVGGRQAGRKKDVLNVCRHSCFDVKPSPRGSQESENEIYIFFLNILG